MENSSSNEQSLQEGAPAINCDTSDGPLSSSSDYNQPGQEAVICRGESLIGDVNNDITYEACSPPVLRQQLSHGEVARYSRQLILPELGVPGQLQLANAKVLIVGCGGLGCPAALYLAAAGVGTLGLLDHDIVEMSNLHRQVLHTEGKVGMSKVDSVMSRLLELNSNIKFVPHRVVLDSSTALSIIQSYDIVLDCTDNVATRYLLNDACVLNKKTLVSGAALRFEGQMTVYNYQGGPCYRCLFPTPPPANTVTNCSDGGVLGVVPGIIGSLQALETIKIIAGIGTVLSGSMLMFDSLSFAFHKVKLRNKKASCTVCGENPTVTALVDYTEFCGAGPTDKDASLSLLEAEQRITVQEYQSMVDKGVPHVLVDVRQPVELGICSLPRAVNVPITQINKQESLDLIQQALSESQATEVICLCRRGNDSQVAALAFSKLLKDCNVKDIIGGLTRWAVDVDTSMPIY